MTLDGEDVSAEIRTPEVTAKVSAVSSVPAVRRQLVALQRQAMGLDGAVVEGRDIATVVAPRAAVKVYLDADPEVRARRARSAEQAASRLLGSRSTRCRRTSTPIRTTTRPSWVPVRQPCRTLLAAVRSRPVTSVTTRQHRSKCLKVPFTSIPPTFPG